MPKSQAHQLLPAPPPPDEPPLLVLELLLLPLELLLLPHEDELPDEEREAGLGRCGITSRTCASCWQKSHFCTRQPQPWAVVVAACTGRRRPLARVR